MADDQYGTPPSLQRLLDELAKVQAENEKLREQVLSYKRTVRRKDSEISDKIAEIIATNMYAHLLSARLAQASEVMGRVIGYMKITKLFPADHGAIKDLEKAFAQIEIKPVAVVEIGCEKDPRFGWGGYENYHELRKKQPGLLVVLPKESNG